MTKWTNARLKDCASKWQGILRLEDWDIAVSFAPKSSIESNGMAHAAVYKQTKDAFILIRNPEEFDAKPAFSDENDVELTLVHELMHVRLAHLCIDEKLSDQEELVVEQIARGFVSMDRGNDAWRNDYAGKRR